MTEKLRYACTGCARTDLSLTAGGTVRSHAADSRKVTPDNPACPGSGLPHLQTGDAESQSLCQVCRRPYPLTSNGRVRSHLTTGQPGSGGQSRCPGGSDLPLGISDFPSAESLPDSPVPAVCPGCSHGEHAGFCDVCGCPPLIGTPVPETQKDPADAFLGTQGTPTADEFLSGNQAGSDDEDREAPWFSSRYDGTCDFCGTHFDAGDRIRADGSGGWEAEDCCGDTDVPEPDTHARRTGHAEVRRPVTRSLQLPVRSGRYVGPHPETGKKTTWTRTTNFAETISDSYALDQWKGRMTILGLVLRPDLIAKTRSIVQGEVPYEVAKTARGDLNGIVEQAKEAAGSKTRAKKGTILHKHTEEIDSGRKTLADIPEEFRPDVAGYLATVKAAGFRPVVQMIERSVVSRKLGVVGTFDRILEVVRDQKTADLNGREVTLRKGEFVIGDVKSGADLKYAWREIQIQLSVYASAVNENGVAVPVTDDDGKTVWGWSPLPEYGIPAVREDVGIVMHMPYGEARCSLYYADLAEGWRTAEICRIVQELRKTKMPEHPVAAGRAEKDPATGGQRESDDVTQTGDTWAERFRAVRTREGASALWNEARKLGVSPDELAHLVSMVSLESPALPGPLPEPSQPSYEDRCSAVTTRAEASAIFQELRNRAEELGAERITRLIGLMKSTLASRV